MRYKLLVVLLYAALLAHPDKASAVTIQTTDTSHPWQLIANTSQAPTFAGTVPLTVAPQDSACGDDAGCTAIFPQVDQTTGQILPGPPASVSIQLATGDPADMERGYLYHELGHVFDTEYMTPATRQQFMAIWHIGADPTRWWYTQTALSNSTPHTPVAFSPGEWFAESYRMCATWGINQPGPTVTHTYEDYVFPGDRTANRAQQRASCQLIDRVANINGIPTPTQKTYPHKKTKAKSPH